MFITKADTHFESPSFILVMQKEIILYLTELQECQTCREYTKPTFIRKVFPHREGCKTNDRVDACSKQSCLLKARFTFSNLAMYMGENHHMVPTVGVGKFFQGRNQLVYF